MSQIDNTDPIKQPLIPYQESKQDLEKAVLAEVISKTLSLLDTFFLWANRTCTWLPTTIKGFLEDKAAAIEAKITANFAANCIVNFNSSTTNTPQITFDKGVPKIIPSIKQADLFNKAKEYKPKKAEDRFNALLKNFGSLYYSQVEAIIQNAPIPLTPNKKDLEFINFRNWMLSDTPTNPETLNKFGFTKQDLESIKQTQNGFTKTLDPEYRKSNLSSLFLAISENKKNS